jgi:trans-aconitate methyltransferase
MAAFAAQVTDRRPLDVLDLGSGTGRFTAGLAAEFQGRVYGVEPSDRMRATAEQAPHPGVTYLKGSLAAAKALAIEAGLTPGEDVVRIMAEEPRTLRERYERLSHRALSTFEHLPADEVEQGFARFAADAEHDPDRVMPVYAATTLVLTRPS